MNKDLIIERYKNPKNIGEIEDSLVGFSSNSSCGDDVTVYLKVENKKILDCKFKALACSICVANTDLLLDRVKNLNIDEVKEIKDEEMYSFIDMESDSPRKRCATLPLEAVKNALNNVE